MSTPALAIELVGLVSLRPWAAGRRFARWRAAGTGCGAMRHSEPLSAGGDLMSSVRVNDVSPMILVRLFGWLAAAVAFVAITGLAAFSI